MALPVISGFPDSFSYIFLLHMVRGFHDTHVYCEVLYRRLLCVYHKRLSSEHTMPTRRALSLCLILARHINHLLVSRVPFILSLHILGFALQWRGSIYLNTKTNIVIHKINKNN